MGERYDVVIIGAGIIGAATALGLARKGVTCLSLDRLPAAGYGSTSGSCAIIRPYYSTLDGCALAYEGHFYWLEWPDFIGIEDERGLARYVNCGSVIMKTESNGHLASVLALMDELQVPYQELTPAALKQRLPLVTTESFGHCKHPDDDDFGEPTGAEVAGAVFFPTSGYITDPQLASHNLQVAAEAAGASFRFNADVVEIRRAGGRVCGVSLGEGSVIDAPVVVNIAGPHSAKINDMAGVLDGMKIKTRALRHEVAHIPSPPDFDFEARGCVFSDSEVGTYCRPELGGKILLGSEDPPGDTREWVDPDDFDRNFTNQWQVQVMRLAQRMPSLPIPGQASGVVELYDVTDDWIPIYDRSDLDGFYMAIGTSGNQFKNAPVVGEMMAALIQACEGGRDHDADPVTFHLKHVDRTVSLGFYSRNREINPESSFSVLG